MTPTPPIPIPPNWSRMTPEQWINYAWDMYPNVEDPSERATLAWRALLALRHEVGSQNLNPAYAEHYMYARNAAGHDGDFYGEILKTIGWEGLKWVGFANGNKDVSKVDKDPPSPPTLDALRYGFWGSWQGQVDYASGQHGFHGWQFVPIIPGLWFDRRLILHIIDKLTGDLLNLTKDIRKNFTSEAPGTVVTACMASPANPSAELNVSGKLLTPTS